MKKSFITSGPGVRWVRLAIYLDVVTDVDYATEY